MTAPTATYTGLEKHGVLQFFCLSGHSTDHLGVHEPQNDDLIGDLQPFQLNLEDSSASKWKEYYVRAFVSGLQVEGFVRASAVKR